MHAAQNNSDLMQRCLELAIKAEGRTSPNPLVGCIILDKDGVVAGEGYHHAAGQDHAEVEALNIAKEKAQGGTLFVNLEPCSHHGKTPPCTEAIIKAGIKKVVVAIEDPNPRVKGSGFAKLKSNGIDVEVGTLEKEAIFLNRGFIKGIEEGLPWLVLKLASTMDGRIADRHGESKWITGAGARSYVQGLRNRFDSVFIGAETVKQDNPRLTVREIDGGRSPARVILDSGLRLDKTFHVLYPDENQRTIVYCSDSSFEAKENQIKIKDTYGAIELVKMVMDNQGRFDLRVILADLYKRGINTVLCEGGGRLAGSLLRDKLVDEIFWFIAPKLLPDSMAIASTASNKPLSIREALEFELLNSSTIENDTLMHLMRREDSLSAKLYDKLVHQIQ